MSAAGVSGPELAARLRVWADGYPTIIASVELLTEHGYWLDRGDFRAFVEVGDDPFSPAGRASFNAGQVLSSLRAGTLAAQSSATAVLAVACSLAGGGEVDLREITLALDPTAAGLVARALLTAGSR